MHVYKMKCARGGEMKLQSLQKKAAFILLGAISIVGFQNCAKPGSSSEQTELQMSAGEQQLVEQAPADIHSEELLHSISAEASIGEGSSVGNKISLSTMSVMSSSGTEIIMNLQDAQNKGKLPSWLTFSNKGVSLGKICIDNWTARLIAKVSNYLKQAQICEKPESEFNLCKEALKGGQLSFTLANGKVINAQQFCANGIDFCDPTHRLFTLMAIRSIQSMQKKIESGNIPANLQCADAQ